MSKTATITKASRGWARRILGPKLTALVKRPFRPRLGSLAKIRAALQSRCALEIGGPSPMFSRKGEIPIYDVLQSLDNCLYSGNTIWTGQVGEGATFVYDSKKRPGNQIIADATDLKTIQNQRYECVLSCHSLEHIANPLRALNEWKRVLQDNGLLLLILPHKDGTFDWRRPVTPLAHMVEDYDRGTAEDDLTHLPEIIELHDLSKDLPAGTKEQFRMRCLENATRRAMHHHVFDTMTALSIVGHAGFQIISVETLIPCHIIVLASNATQAVDNHRFADSSAAHWKRSSLPSDKGYSNQ